MQCPRSPGGDPAGSGILPLSAAGCKNADPDRLWDENEYEIYDDRTFLSEVLDVYTGRGVVEDNSYTSLTGDSSLNQGNVKIGGLVFTMDFAKAKDLLGYSVEYYYRDTNDMDMPSLIWAQKLSSNQK